MYARYCLQLHITIIGLQSMLVCNMSLKLDYLDQSILIGLSLHIITIVSLVEHTIKMGCSSVHESTPTIPENLTKWPS